MMHNRMLAAWLRPVAGLFALVAALALSACGGGSGAPNNAFAPLAITPANLTIVSGVPATLTVSGGTPPYSASSNNPGVLPVAQSVAGNTIPLSAAGVAGAATVNITVTDSNGRTVATTVTVQPGSLAVVPATAVIYSGVAATLNIVGGSPPYRVFSSNTGILPVTQAVPGSTIVLLAGNVLADTSVTLTVQDSVGQSTTAAITVSPAPLLNSLTVTPNLPDCGKNAICSGQTGTAAVTVSGPGGAPLAGRQVRFDAVTGPFGISPPGNGQAPLVSTLTVVSDSLGNATVVIKAAVDAPTQFAQIRATDLTSGQQLTGTFLIQQVTDGSAILSVVPDTATITGPFKGQCSTGFRVDYFIFGGTPPYQVKSTFPSAVTIVNPTVSASGGFFEAVTNGICGTATISIVDATGRQITATLINQEGTATAPVTPTALTITPPSVTVTGLNSCTGKTFTFVLSGGTPPYNVVSAGAVVTPNPVAASPGTVNISGLIDGSGAHTVLVGDASTPQLTTTATITCKP